MLVMTFEALGYRDVQGRYAKRSKKLEERSRSMVRQQSRLLMEELRQEAPRDTGEFAAGIRYQTRVTSQGVKSTIYVRGKHAFLLPYIVHGTEDHDIPKGGALVQMAKGYPLRFFWENGPRGPDIYYFWSVHHPGTAPNDFVQRAIDERWPDAKKALQQVGRSATYNVSV